MATLYFESIVDTNWDTLGNWFTDKLAGTAAGRLPVTGDDIVITKKYTTGGRSFLEHGPSVSIQPHSMLAEYGSYITADLSLFECFVIFDGLTKSGGYDSRLGYFGKVKNIRLDNGGVMETDATCEHGIFINSPYVYGIVADGIFYGAAMQGAMRADFTNAIFINSSNYLYSEHPCTARLYDSTNQGHLTTGYFYGTSSSTGSGHVHTKINVASFYFTNAVDTNWNTLGNWWRDSAHSVAASILPDAYSDVIIEGTLNIGPTVMTQPQRISFKTNGVNNIDLSAFTAVIKFSNNSINNNTIPTGIFGPIQFIDSSVNNGLVNSAAFSNTSSNGISGSVATSAVFSTGTTNLGTVASATFNNGSHNEGACTVAYFNGTSYNDGTVVTGYFSDISNGAFYLGNNYRWGVGTVANYGTPISLWKFNNNSTNYGYCPNASFEGQESTNRGTCGAATFLTGSNYGTIETALFNGTGTNRGVVTGNATFNNGAANHGTCNSFTTFHNGSINWSDGTCTDIATFDSTSNNTGICNIAIFEAATGGICRVGENEKWGSGTANITKGLDNNPISSWIFSSNSVNAGICENAVFNDESVNSETGNCGNSAFNNTAENRGNCSIATFNNSSLNSGTCETGTFNDASKNTGSITLSATFNNTEYRSTDIGSLCNNTVFPNGAIITVDGIEFTQNTSTWTGGTVVFRFINAASLSADGRIACGIFEDSCLNNGSCQDARFYDNAINVGSVTENGYFYMGSTNIGAVNTIIAVGTLYFRDIRPEESSPDYGWDSETNWWTDETFSTPYGRIPIDYDVIEIRGDLKIAAAIPVQPHRMHFHTDSSYEIPNGATSSVDLSSMKCIIRFTGFSQTSGGAIDTASFRDYSVHGVDSIVRVADFNSESKNSGNGTTAIFRDASVFNGGTFTNAAFNNSSSFVTGSIENATFNDTTNMYAGSVVDAIFNGTCCMAGGSITGSATFNEGTTCVDINSSVNNITWNSYNDCYATLTGTSCFNSGGFRGSCLEIVTFNSMSTNYGNILEGIFKDSAGNSGNCSYARFYGASSYNYYGNVTTAYFYAGTYDFSQLGACGSMSFEVDTTINCYSQAFSFVTDTWSGNYTCHFYYGSAFSGSCNKAVFHDTSCIQWGFCATASFYDTTHADGASIVAATFYNSSYGGGGYITNAILYDDSYLNSYANVTTATFNNASKMQDYGTTVGTAIFNNTSSIRGDASCGIATFNDESYINTGYITTAFIWRTTGIFMPAWNYAIPLSKTLQAEDVRAGVSIVPLLEVVGSLRVTDSFSGAILG